MRRVYILEFLGMSDGSNLMFGSESNRHSTNPHCSAREKIFQSEFIH